MGSRMKRAVAGTAAALVVAVAGAVIGPGTSPASASTMFDVPTCADQPDGPCVATATVNGEDVLGGSCDCVTVAGETITATVPDDHVMSIRVGGTGVAVGDAVSVTVRLGAFMTPRVYGFRSGTRVKPVSSGDAITFGGTAVRTVRTDGSVDVGFEVALDDLAGWVDTATASLVAGAMQWTNLGGLDGVLPRPTCGSNGCATQLYFDGPESAVDPAFVGRGTYRWPYRALRAWWGVPNPATMKPHGFVLGRALGATISLHQDPAGGAVLVTIEGVSFPRTGPVDVRLGTITPTRPSALRTTRRSPSVGVVHVGKASVPRGARVTGYVAHCVSGSHVVSRSAPRRTVVLHGLRPRRVYTCKVRALSEVGPSRWSGTRKVAARP